MCQICVAIYSIKLTGKASDSINYTKYADITFFDACLEW